MCGRFGDCERLYHAAGRGWHGATEAACDGPAVRAGIAAVLSIPTAVVVQVDIRLDIAHVVALARANGVVVSLVFAVAGIVRICAFFVGMFVFLYFEFRGEAGDFVLKNNSFASSVEWSAP
jgi:hypothetical protein